MTTNQTLADLAPMTADQVLDVMEWMNKQAITAHKEIKQPANDAERMRNSYYEGMRNAFLEAIHGLMSAQHYQCANCGATGPLESGHMDKWNGVEQWICPDCIEAFKREAHAADHH